MAASPIQAMAAMYTTEVTNGISMGDINVSISEFEYDADGNEVTYKDEKMIVPGQKVDKIIRINNSANKAWVRAKLSYTDWNGFNGLSDDDVELASDLWVKVGDYYYCTAPVEKSSSVDLIKAVHIPSDWKEDRSNGIFQIFTSVDAVQAANFTPDFSSDDPWFGTVIEECVHTTHNVTEETGGQAFQVVFENGAEGLVKVGDDFFSNWSSLMPGDVVSDKVTIRNNYSRPMTIFFHTETIADDDLLNAVHIIIKNGDEILYDGPLNGTTEKNICLGSYSRNGNDGEITYTLSVPAELTNKYALASTKTKWVFQCYYNNGGGGSSSGGGNPTSDKTTETVPVETTATETPTASSSEAETLTPNEPNANRQSGDSSKGIIPRLGENKTTLLSIIGGILVVLCGGAVVMKKKSNEEENRENKGE